MEPYATSKSQNNGETKALKNAYSFQSNSSLHTVRKSQAKPWKKAPVAPPPPTAIRVFNVDPMNFRDVVQQLTGAPEFKPHQLAQSVAMPPTPNQMLSNRQVSSTVSTNWYQAAQSEALVMKSQEITAGTNGLLELNLSSPSSYNWCSVPHTQATITTFEPGRVI